MRRLLDLPLLALCLLASPVWLVRMALRGKLRTDWRGRLGGSTGPRIEPTDRPRVLVHAVSVGEVSLVQPLVAELTRPAQGADPMDVVLSVTTDTGIARARQLADETVPVIRTPFPFVTACERWLDRVRPDLLVLVELEVWPTMVAAARARGIPVVVVNGRLTARSLRRYRRIRGLIRRAFASLTACAVQDETIGARFRELGVPPERLHVFGTMKWDTARISDDVPEAADLARDLGIDPDRPLVVAGSTAPEETTLVDAAVGDRAQVLIAPRKPEWFDDAAAALPGCVRRTGRGSGDAADSREPNGRGGTSVDRPTRFLLDTIGELRAAYALADVVVVGRSFGTLHGSDMMEPIGLGRATIVGPRTGDFESTMRALLAADAIVQVEGAELGSAIATLLDDPAGRRALAERGRAVIRAHQGTADRHAGLLREVLDTHRGRADCG